MALEFDAPENQDQEGTFLTEPGKYHCLVHSVETDPLNKDGGQITNAAFRVHASVLEGTTAGQKDKEFNLMFFNPKMTDKDNGEMAKKKILFFAQSIGCGAVVNGKIVIKFGPDPHDPDYDEGATNIGCKYAEGKQFVVELEKDRDGKYLTLRFCNVWHVDHPAVKDVPKCKASLAMIPAALRKSEKDFQKPGQKPGNGAGSGAKQNPPQPQKPAAAATPPVDGGDL